MTEASPHVFISYSHDSDEHRARVLDLADRLRGDGIDAVIDQYVQSPPEGWPAWCEAEIRKAAFVPMVCTETYLRRVNGEEEAGKGHGVLWEARLIRQHLYDTGSVNSKFVPVLLADGAPAFVPTPVKGGTIYRIETTEGYEALLRLLTRQPETPMPPLGQRKPLPPRQRRSTGTTSVEPSKPTALLPHPRVEDVFVGRREEREQIAAALFPTSGMRRPVVVSGMAGVGKSYLVDRVYRENMERFPGGYLRLALDPDKPASAAELLASLRDQRDQLKLPAGASENLAAQLLTPLTLIHFENADDFRAGRVVSEAADSLPDCALVISGRFRDLGFAVAWRLVPLRPFDETEALQQLATELPADMPGRESWPALAAAVGHLPLALHLAAGYLRTGDTVAAFLRRLRRKNLALTGADPADRTFRDRSHALLSDTFELSLDALRRQGGTDGESWVAGLAALGHAPATGFGASLGAAISGLSAEGFEDMTREAASLSLLEGAPRGVEDAFRLHPLLAELVRPRANKDAAIGGMTEWFVARLPAGGEGQGTRWRELHDETTALAEWLAQISPVDRSRVERAGGSYAIHNGPYHAWIQFCEEALAGEIDDKERSNFLWVLGNTALRGGLPERARAAAEVKCRLDQERGDPREAAHATDLIADILAERGDHDEALRIREQDLLPIYEQIGDLDSVAITKGKIADILRGSGDLSGACRIYEDVRLVLLKLGDVRAAALAREKVARILAAQGDLDQGLRILQREVLPDFEHLGDVHDLVTARRYLADMHLCRNQEGDRDEAVRLLGLALGEARRLKLSEAEQIERIIDQAGLSRLSNRSSVPGR